jgi:hypothetical protein
MSNEKLQLWNAVKRPPKEALKTIQAGRLKGMSDINPQWRLQIMTEMFGPVGIGWYYEVVSLWTEQGATGEVMAFAHIHLYTKNGEAWSAPIAGIGGSALVAKESNGLRANDEAYKMATTDALSVAMKQLGIAADIYMGLWDGSKYKEDPKQDNQPLDTSNAERELVAAVKKGTTELRKVWDKQDETVRLALKSKLAGWKEQAAKQDSEIATQA